MADTNAPPQPQPEKKKKLLNGTNIEYKYPSGSVYQGGFKDGKLHGFGKYKYHPSGDVYEGEWLSDMKHGHGIYTYDGGDRYTGEWRAGKKHGKGTYVFASGDEYVGAWADDKIHGFGVFLIARNGNRYEGNWEESYRQGHGVLTSGNGDVYDGLWVRGKEEGLGLFTYANGNVYCGDWRAGAMDGKGILLERGQKHTVEHIAGYLIAKVPIDDDTAVEEAWQNADRLYRNYRKRLQKEAAEKASGGGGADKVDSQALVKATMEAAMWKRRYEEVIAQKTEELLAGEPADIAGLQRRVVALKVAQEAERNRADTAASQVKLLESEMDQIRHQLKNAELAAAAGGAGNGEGGGSGDDAEAERLRAKVAELTKELDLRKKATAGSPGSAGYSAGGSIDTNDPVELKVRLELAEGELRNLREKREEVYKLREQNMDHLKTIQRIETRNEELLKEINVHRARSSNLQGQINDTASRQFQELTQELAEYKKTSEEASKAKAEAEAVASKAKKGEVLANTRVTDLEIENSRLKQRLGNTDTEIGKNLGMKLDQVESLKKQNADLQRQVDELQYDLSKAKKKNKKGGGGGDDDIIVGGSPTGGAGAAEIESLQADLKKEKKKYKKAVSERDAIAQELYNEQLLTTRLSRAMDTLRGRVAVLAAIDNHTDLENKNTLLRINQENPAEIYIYENGVPAEGADAAADGEAEGKKKKKSKGSSSNTLVEFDACIDSSHTADDLYDELKATVKFTAEGFHTSLVTVGPMGSGKTHALTGILPKLFKGLFEAAQNNNFKANSTFTTAVKVGALEVAHDGVFDVISGGEIMSVSRAAASLEVVAIGETFTEVKDEKELLRLFNEYSTKKRRVSSGRSHFVFHTVIEMRHRVQNILKVGKFTIADLCGQGSLADQERDLDSARYVNTTAKNLSNVFEALVQTADASSSPSVPYAANVFTMLMSDLFGGNCITTVVACASATNKDTITESAASLRLASQLRDVFNRPVLQNHETPDVARLRGLVAEAVDKDQSTPSMKEISNIRI